MKRVAKTNAERHIKWETAKQNKIALDVLRGLVYVEMRPIVLALIEKAKGGDHKTAELLFDRAFGKTPASVEHTGEIKFSLTGLAQQWEDQQRVKLEAARETE